MKILFIVLLIFSSKSFAGYFKHHVVESIGINQERRPFYKELTQGQSEMAFKKLLRLEYALVPFAWMYDTRAKYYQKRGVNLLKDEFVSMNRAPDFDPNRRVIPQEEFSPIPWKNYKKELSDAIESEDGTKIKNVSLAIIAELSAQPHYYCMTRHLVESVYRIAYFTPVRIQAARELKIKSPKGILKEIMKFHLIGFKEFVAIDKAAAPVQKLGIPLLCMELPNLLEDLEDH